MAIDWSESQTLLKLLVVSYKAQGGKKVFSGGIFRVMAELWGEGTSDDIFQKRYRIIDELAETLPDAEQQYPQAANSGITGRATSGKLFRCGDTTRVPPNGRPRARLGLDDQEVIKQSLTQKERLRRRKTPAKHTSSMPSSDAMDISHGRSEDDDDDYYDDMYETSRTSSHSPVSTQPLGSSITSIPASFETVKAVKVGENLRVRPACISHCNSEEQASKGTTYFDPRNNGCMLCRKKGWDNSEQFLKHEAESELHRVNLLSPERVRAADQMLMGMRSFAPLTLYLPEHITSHRTELARSESLTGPYQSGPRPSSSNLPIPSLGTQDSPVIIVDAPSRPERHEDDFHVTPSATTTDTPDVSTSVMPPALMGTESSPVIIMDGPSRQDKGKGRARVAPSATPTAKRRRRLVKELRRVSAEGRSKLRGCSAHLDLIEDIAMTLESGCDPFSAS